MNDHTAPDPHVSCLEVSFLQLYQRSKHVPSSATRNANMDIGLPWGCQAPGLFVFRALVLGLNADEGYCASMGRKLGFITRIYFTWCSTALNTCLTLHMSCLFLITAITTNKGDMSWFFACGLLPNQSNQAACCIAAPPVLCPCYHCSPV